MDDDERVSSFSVLKIERKWKNIAEYVLTVLWVKIPSRVFDNDKEIIIHAMCKDYVPSMNIINIAMASQNIRGRQTWNFALFSLLNSFSVVAVSCVTYSEEIVLVMTSE